MEALESRRAALEAAIAAVRDRATAEVRVVGEAATAEARAREFERLARQAQELRVEVALPHALRHPEAAVWGEVRPEAWVGLLDALLRWAQLGAVAGTEVPLPNGLRGQVKGSRDSPGLYGPPPACGDACALAGAGGGRPDAASAGPGRPAGRDHRPQGAGPGGRRPLARRALPDPRPGSRCGWPCPRRRKPIFRGSEPRGRYYLW